MSTAGMATYDWQRPQDIAVIPFVNAYGTRWNMVDCPWSMRRTVVTAVVELQHLKPASARQACD